MILAACDSSLLGKTISEGDLEITVNERFYGGEEVSEEKFLELLKECFSANLIGEETVNAARKVYKLQRVLYIEDIPHAIIFKM